MCRFNSDEGFLRSDESLANEYRSLRREAQEILKEMEKRGYTASYLGAPVKIMYSPNEVVFVRHTTVRI